jgi:NAD(P)-dependent dehydrogenase (short-subunit alcohol dehydrogenase family)
MSQLRFDDRVAVITGAGRGLGRAYALLLASRGAKVVVNDPGADLDGQGLDAGPAEDVVAMIEAAGGEAVACTASVATGSGGQRIIDMAIEHFGRLDILIHNAGNVLHRSLVEMTIDQFDAVLDVHLRGAFHVVHPAFGTMVNAGYGRIILTSSIGGLYGNHGVANYAASKAGVIGLNNVAALEGAAHGITSNVIIPGALTRIAAGADRRGMPADSESPGRRLRGMAEMSPDNVAPVVAWLAHESCSITGELFVSVAGRVARAFIAESHGVYQQTWTIEDVADRIDEIRNASSPWILPVVPDGHAEHIRRSMKMAR